MYERKFLISLLLTLAAEIPTVFLILKFLYKKRDIKIFRTILIAGIASTLTLPYFWFVLPHYITSRMIYSTAGESLIILAEAIIYGQFFQLKFSKAFFLSLIANLTSMLLGFIVL